MDFLPLPKKKSETKTAIKYDHPEANRLARNETVAQLNEKPSIVDSIISSHADFTYMVVMKDQEDVRLPYIGSFNKQ